jgi:signal transduction histidine kinase
MEQQTFRASNLVNNLLDLIANRPRTREIVSATELVTQTVTLHEDLFAAKGIQVHCDVTPLRLGGNFQDLQQVLTNILLNARDAVSQGGNIWISVKDAGDEAVIRVRDDGRGIAPDMIDRVFDPLVTTKRGQGGTGLGLAISRRLIHACDGEITVESTPGEGAEFTITLPRMDRLVGSMQ